MSDTPDDGPAGHAGSPARGGPVPSRPLFPRDRDDSGGGFGPTGPDAPPGEPTPIVTALAAAPAARLASAPTPPTGPPGPPGRIRRRLRALAGLPRRRPGLTAALAAAVVLAAGAAAAAVLAEAPGGTGGLAERWTRTEPARTGADGGGVGGVGERVASGGLEFTVTEVHTGVRRVGGEVTGERAEGRFVIARVRVRNTGEEAATFTDADQRLVDSRGRRHAPDNSAGLRVGGSGRLFGRLGPGEEGNGGLVFDIPAGAEPVELRLSDFRAEKPAVVRLDP